MIRNTALCLLMVLISAHTYTMRTIQVPPRKAYAHGHNKPVETTQPAATKVSMLKAIGQFSQTGSLPAHCGN